MGTDLGRRQPRLFAIKLGPAKGKGLWKFREEDVHQFIQDQRRRKRSSELGPKKLPDGSDGTALPCLSDWVSDY